MYFFSQYLKDEYGKSLYRIPIDLPLSCPHRIANAGDGCVFCPENGARARHLRLNLDLQSQVSKGKEYIVRRYGEEVGYIAYFQSFTNTNASVHKLREYYSSVLKLLKFEMVIIATRPDCLPDEVLDYLSELNEEYDLWVELGVQSANERTLELINRQHDFKCVENSAKALHARNIKSAPHVIIGLPGEGLNDYIATAEALAVLPFSGIKIHNLLVLKNTPLGRLYQKQLEGINTDFPFIKPLNEYEYADLLLKFLEYIPESWPLMRVVADAGENEITAPKWWMKKGQFIEYIKKREGLSERDFEVMPSVLTEDGSYTLYHPEYRQHFHSLSGANSEAMEKFIKPSQIESMLQGGQNVRVLDIGFGLGVNALTLLEISESIAVGNLEIVSLEKDIRTIQASVALTPDSEILNACVENFAWRGKYSTIKIIIDDARKSVDELKRPFDAVFLDAFSHNVNPELWTYEFIGKLAALLKINGVILTYSSAFPVLGAFKRNGLHIGEVKAENSHRAGIICSFDASRICNPLPENKMKIIACSTAGVAYRGPEGNESKDDIFLRRFSLVKKLQKKGVPKWYKPNK